MKRILVPCDFTEPAKQAYTFALNLAGRFDSEVFVVKAIDIPYLYETAYAEVSYLDPGLITELEEDAKKSFYELKKGHKRQEKIHFKVAQGPVTAAIKNAIEDLKADLVVMGTTGASGLREYFIGSNTEKIVRFSPVPVIALRRSILTAEIDNIVVPTTLDLAEEKVITRIFELQKLFDATLHFLTVNTPYQLKRTQDRQIEIDRFIEKFKPTNYTMNVRDDFAEEDAILSFAKEKQADMIAMGTHARKGLSHLFMGSIAEDVVNHGSCAIWSYKI